MKYFILPLLLISCTLSKEDKAKKLAKADLKQSLNDLKSYEDVSWSKLDSSFTDVANHNKFSTSKAIFDSIESIIKLRLDTIKHLKIDYEIFGKYGDEIAGIKESLLEDSYQMKKAKWAMDYAISNWKDVFVGYKITHVFRAKNNSGNYILAKFTYEFDSTLSKINKRTDNSETN